MVLVHRKEDIPSCTEKYYYALARFMVNLVDIPDNCIILEPGCGHGALTGFLQSLIDNYSKYICYDLYSGVYEESLLEIRKKSVKDIIIGDVREISMHTESVDLIFSNELLCELTREGCAKTMGEVYRVLKPHGVFVHGVLSPYPENRAQELVVLADDYSAEPLFPKEWFSPPADELAGMLHQAGFSHIGVQYFEGTLKYEGEAAFQILQDWVTSPQFLKRYVKDVKEHGLELPMEQVIFCQK